MVFSFMCYQEIGGDGGSIDLAYSPIVQSGGKYDLK